MSDELLHVTPRVRKGHASTRLTKEEFRIRWRERFYDPAFDAAPDALERLFELAWESYDGRRKSPRTQRAGDEFADREFELPAEWLEARRRIREAEERHASPDLPSRVLLVCASPRTDQTCSGEMSKTLRLVNEARATLEAIERFEVDLLDLSLITAEYGRTILPCKACVSTAMPLCHWPCSCYPNHALGQVNDWMNEIYPRWVAAHGVMIVTPVHWYQAPSVLKLMMDRLVCADGGNPDPTTTAGKSAEKAKALELEGWTYAKHLAGRAFSVIVHGNAAGADAVRRGLHDWLREMALVSTGDVASFDRYIARDEPFAISHDALDGDAALVRDVRTAARALAETVLHLRRTAATPSLMRT